MNKELQNKAWNCFPKEFKKEVKRMYKTCAEAESIGQFIKLFGYDNLTSDAEGVDEMLCVSRKQIDALQGEIFKAIMDAHDADDWQDAAHYILDVMPRSFAALFGSMCLPDEEPKPAEPKFEKGDIVRYRYDRKIYIVECKTGQYHYTLRQADGDIMMHDALESDLEPYTELKENQNPSNSTELKPQDVDKQFDNILKDSFAKERRLNIATTIIEHIIKSEYYSLSEKYREDNIKEMVKVSLQITDAIMAECEKGGVK